jgi:hypothetical protein
MKPQQLFASLSAVILLFAGCKKDDTSNDLFNTKNRLAALWVPYEIIENGTVIQGPFTGSSFFGAYAESVMILDDNTFVPVIFVNAVDKLLKMDEMGIYDFYPLQRKMEMSGAWQIQLYVDKLTDDEMWLRENHVLRKFRKQPY